MDDKLEKYRNQIRRKEFFNKIKQRLISMVTIAPEINHKKDETIEIPDVSETISMEILIIQPKLMGIIMFIFILYRKIIW